MSKTAVIVGLGSNIEPLKNLRAAVSELKKVSYFNLKKISSIYESDAQVLENSDQKTQKKYLNAAVFIEIENFDALECLCILKSIEKKLGRINTEKWAPREIDLDILYVENFKLETNELTIPHKQFTARPFALLPALDVFEGLKIELPLWSKKWFEKKPFNTKKSVQFFWPQFVGILNVTTDSFSDGNQFLNEKTFKAQAAKLIAAGADILDIGAESTRPEASAITAEFEFEKLNLALSWLKEMNLATKISIDCRNDDVLQKVLSLHHIDYLNDVTGFDNPNMLQILKQTKIPAVVMHSLTIPPNQNNILKVTESPSVQLFNWFKNKLEIFEKNDINLNRIIFDPGIGFGKSPKQNSHILNHLDELSEIKNDFYLGFSRKSYLNQFTDAKACERDLASAIQLVQINPLYCQYLRTHDIESQKTALKIAT